MPRHLLGAHDGERHSLLMRDIPQAGVLACALAIAWPVQAADSPATFVQAATRSGMFKTFLDLIDKAQVADRLDARPATVFMPTDRAFAHLTPAQRDAIAALSPDDAKRFVSHFVVPGVALKSNNIDQDITAEDGTSYNVTWFMGRLSLRDHRGPAPGPLAFVVDGDNQAGPSAIDAVDRVLMPAFLDRPAPADLPAPASASAASPSALVPPPAPPPSAPPALGVTAPVTSPAVAAPPTPLASTSASLTASGSATAPEPKPAPPAPPPQPSPTLPPITPAVTTALAKPDINITTGNLRGWPVRTSGNGPTGKVDRVVVGIPSGRITGLTATFGGFFGIGGKRVFIAWPLVTVDPQAKAIRVRMTADDLKSTPSNLPVP